MRFYLLFKTKLDIDPWRYTTLASLRMAIYRGKFLPGKTIVSNDQNKPVSVVSKEWLLHENDENVQHEVPIFINKQNLDIPPEDLHRGKVGNDTKIYFNGNKHTLHPDALDRKKKIVK